MEEACLNLRILFDRAVEDYLCKKRVWLSWHCLGVWVVEAIQVWVLYCQFAVDKMEVFEVGVEFVRGVFERVVTACGQHVATVTN